MYQYPLPPTDKNYVEQVPANRLYPRHLDTSKSFDPNHPEEHWVAHMRQTDLGRFYQSKRSNGQFLSIRHRSVMPNFQDRLKSPKPCSLVDLLVFYENRHKVAKDRFRAPGTMNFLQSGKADNQKFKDQLLPVYMGEHETDPRDIRGMSNVTPHQGWSAWHFPDVCSNDDAEKRLITWFQCNIVFDLMTREKAIALKYAWNSWKERFLYDNMKMWRHSGTDEWGEVMPPYRFICRTRYQDENWCDPLDTRRIPYMHDWLPTPSTGEAPDWVNWVQHSYVVPVRHGFYFVERYTEDPRMELHIRRGQRE